MDSEKKPGTSGTTTKCRIRTNLAFMEPIKLYVPDGDESVPHAFALGRRTVLIAQGCEQDLLSGYFSALCAAFPDLTNIAKQAMQNLGFRIQEITIPSQTGTWGIDISHKSQDLKREILMLAQMCYLPFTNYFDATLEGFWSQVAGNVGVNLSSYMMCSIEDMRAISSALMMSGLKAELKSFIGPALQAQASTSTPFGGVLSEAARLTRPRTGYSGYFSL